MSVCIEISVWSDIYNQQIIEFSNGNPNEFWHCPLLHRSSYNLKTQILGSTRPITILDVLVCRQLLVFITHYTHNYMANFRPFIWWWLAFRSQNHQKSSYIYYRYNVIHSKIKNTTKKTFNLGKLQTICTIIFFSFSNGTISLSSDIYIVIYCLVHNFSMSQPTVLCKQVLTYETSQIYERELGVLYYYITNTTYVS